jgi:hypothetical protein
MKPHSYAHLIFDKGAKNIKWRKTASSTNVAGKSYGNSEDVPLLTNGLRKYGIYTQWSFSQP